ncbi:MAG: hypothetical protein A2X12_11625 [Bacteroidetes bacterium GWE2_29_8]|nr:MAG: hypothetical protein A2X12_11625 [Bacteroidetes bacterium GWE2_29_8]OFY24380.1 MAG: hypothetical protein A2X02_08290 [Bacteroidetes bacterium GWF2_29_10]
MKTKMILKVFLALFCFITYSNTSLAQTKTITQPTPSQVGRATPEMVAERRTNHLKTQLNLNDEQFAKVKSLMLDQEKKRRIERENMQKGEGLAKGKDSSENNKKIITEKMKSILNAEQFKKFMDMEKKNEEIRNSRLENNKNITN